MAEPISETTGQAQLTKLSEIAASLAKQNDVDTPLYEKIAGVIKEEGTKDTKRDSGEKKRDKEADKDRGITHKFLKTMADVANWSKKHTERMAKFALRMTSRLDLSKMTKNMMDKAKGFAIGLWDIVKKF